MEIQNNEFLPLEFKHKWKSTELDNNRQEMLLYQTMLDEYLEEEDDDDVELLPAAMLDNKDDFVNFIKTCQRDYYSSLGHFKDESFLANVCCEDITEYVPAIIPQFVNRHYNTGQYLYLLNMYLNYQRSANPGFIDSISKKYQIREVSDYYDFHKSVPEVAGIFLSFLLYGAAEKDDYSCRFLKEYFRTAFPDDYTYTKKIGTYDRKKFCHIITGELWRSRVIAMLLLVFETKPSEECKKAYISYLGYCKKIHEYLTAKYTKSKTADRSPEEWKQYAEKKPKYEFRRLVESSNILSYIYDMVGYRGGERKPIDSVFDMDDIEFKNDTVPNCYINSVISTVFNCLEKDFSGLTENEKTLWAIIAAQTSEIVKIKKEGFRNISSLCGITSSDNVIPNFKVDGLQVVSNMNPVDDNEDLNTRISELEKQLAQKTSECRDYKNDVLKKKTKIVNLQDQLKKSADRNSSLENRIKMLESEVNKLKNEKTHNTDSDMENQIIPAANVSDSNDKIVEDISFLQEKKLVVIGGHSSWVSKMERIFKKWTFIDADSVAFGSRTLTKDADAICLVTQYVSHSQCDKFKSGYGRSGTKLIYLNNTNLNIVLDQLHQEFA